MALEPPPSKAPCFAQLYVLDSHAIADTVKGMAFGDRVDGSIVEALADMLKSVNDYVQQFKRAATIDLDGLNCPPFLISFWLFQHTPQNLGFNIKN